MTSRTQTVSELQACAGRPPPPLALFAAHVRASRSRAPGTWVAKAAVSVPGLMRKGLAHDCKKNLY